MPTQLHSSDPPSAKPLSAHDAFRAVKAAATSVTRGEEIVVENIPAEFALQVILSVEEDPAIAENSLRASYNSLTGRMLLKPKPDFIISSCQGWLQREQAAMVISGWLDHNEMFLLHALSGMTIHAFNSPYNDSVKEPDGSWEILGETIPTLVVETGYMENYQERLRGMDVWIVGSAPQTRAGILIIFDRKDAGMSSFLEVLRPSPANGSTIKHRFDIFPQPNPLEDQLIAITRGDLFGSRLLPGRNASDVWNLDVTHLRQILEINCRLEGCPTVQQ